MFALAFRCDTAPACHARGARGVWASRAPHAPRRGPWPAGTARRQTKIHSITQDTRLYIPKCAKFILQQPKQNTKLQQLSWLAVPPHPATTSTPVTSTAADSAAASSAAASIADPHLLAEALSAATAAASVAAASAAFWAPAVSSKYSAVLELLAVMQQPGVSAVSVFTF